MSQFIMEPRGRDGVTVFMVEVSILMIVMGLAVEPGTPLDARQCFISKFNNDAGWISWG